MTTAPSQTHADFAAVTREWVESRFASGIEDAEPSRDDLRAFVDGLSEETFYEAIQAAMIRLDDLYIGARAPRED